MTIRIVRHDMSPKLQSSLDAFMNYWEEKYKLDIGLERMYPEPMQTLGMELWMAWRKSKRD